ncbi:MAG: hypothetical protein K2P86_08215 [Xanthobacteraceae bacterium]|jgi:hypothetical protein|nr:hypothetical protein [Xanthobacteraceae bacterium]
MKKLLLAGVVLALAIPVAANAQQKRAAPDLWCRDQPLDRSTVQICSAYTYEQCMASRVAQESCYLNPRYDARFRRN